MNRITTTVYVGLMLALQLMLTTSCQQTQALSKNESVAPKAAQKLELVKPSIILKPGEENIRYGFIDHNGQFVIEPKFIGAGCFEGGLASVITDKGHAYIDKSGRFVTQPGEYVTGHRGNCDDTWPNYAEGLHKVTRYFKVSGAKTDDELTYSGYVNAQGKLVIPLAHYYADDFSDGMAQITVEKDVSQEELEESKRRNDATVQERYGYIDTTGKIVIPPQFDRAEAFRWGIARVGVKHFVVDPKDPIRPGAKKAVFHYGFIDKKGRYLVEPTSDLTSEYGCNVSEQLIKNSQALMGKDALTKDSPAIKELCGTPKSEFRDGFATRDIPMPPSTTEMDYVLINQAGKQLFPGITSNSPIRYQRVRDGINEGLALIENYDANALKCYIDNQGNFVIPCRFKEARAFTEGLAAVAVEIDPKKK
jgi:flagellar hook protein FlgE